MLTWILAAGAAACLVYYIVIVAYAGFGTAFAVIWLLLGGFLGTAAAGVRYYQRYPDKLPLWLPVSLVTLCASGMLILLVAQILIFSRIPAAAEPKLDYVIVLGAGVKPDGLSKTLKLRLDKTAEYAKQNPDTVFVLSGGQGLGEPVTEAEAMREYLLDQGVGEDKLLLEDRSYSTLENIAYSRIVISQDVQEKQEQRLREQRKLLQNRILTGPVPAQPEREQRIGLITSNFHLFRAGMIAKKQGLTDVRGIAAESDPVLLVHFCVRDGLALLKDRLMGNL